MKDVHKEKKAPKIFKYMVDHNPYEILSYNNTSKFGKVIVFPVFHYEGERQYIDLLNPVIEKGYHVIIINLLTKADRVLFFNYYEIVLTDLLSDLIQNKVIKNESIIFMGFGVGALLASYLENIKLKGITKFILISPFNNYKDEYSISKEIKNFKIPTYIFYGQNDKVTSLSNRYSIFEKGHTNPKVTFTSYPISGHFLYYKDSLSLEVEDANRDKGYDLVIGDISRFRNSYLPDEVEYNERFYKHLFLILEDKPLPKRIALLMDVFPLFVNGVAIVVNLLKEELDKLGYETYVVALWDKKVSLDKLPADYIPITGRAAKFVKGYRELHMLQNLAFQRNAKTLSLFGFNYLHLNTEYSVGQIALYLSKYTNIKMVYTYHTLWRIYYEKHFGRIAGEITFNAAKDFLFSKIYKECPTIIVPSKKTYEILNGDGTNKDIRVIPSPVDANRFKMTKEDLKEVQRLKDQYKLKDKKVLGYVGRVSMEKNIIETLENVARIKDEIPNITFMIVGSGDAMKSLKKATKKLEIEDNVIFVGEVENSKLKYYYPLFDVFVTASNFETQGLTYFEAATCGTLILAKKDDALDGIFEDGVSAYIYEDMYQWAEKLEKALFTNNKKIIEAAKVSVKKFSPDKWAKQIASIYQEINQNKKAKN